MAMNNLYNDRYKGDLTMTGSSLTNPTTHKWLKAPQITDPSIYVATRGKLSLPVTATVERAFLVWTVVGPEADLTKSSTVYLRTPASATALLSDATKITSTSVEIFPSPYLMQGSSFYADVTNLVKAGKSGDYWIYNLASTPSMQEDDYVKAGWGLYVFYKDPIASYKVYTIYWGILGIGVEFGTPKSFVVNGIQTPKLGPVLGHVGVITAFTTADEPDSVYVQNTPLSDAYTPPDDFDNSISTIDGNLMDTWPTQTAPANENTEEFQTKLISLTGTEIMPNVNSITVKHDVPVDGIDFLLATGFAFQLNEILLTHTKSNQIVSIAPDGIHNTVEYTVKVTNITPYTIGKDAVFYDTLPNTLTYVPESMRIVDNNYGGYTGSLTDASGDDLGYISGGNTIHINLGKNATPSMGGSLEPEQYVTLSYRATINNNAAPGSRITNTSNVTIKSAETDEVFSSTATSNLTVPLNTRGIPFL